jgi:hypothetical protein
MLFPVSIFLILLGGISTFALRWDPYAVDFDAVGVVLMLAGALGLTLHRYVLQRRREAARMSGHAPVRLYDHPGAMPRDPRDPRADD